MPTTLPFVRNRAEMNVYLVLRQCPCRGGRVDAWADVEVEYDGEPARRFAGVCATCGRERRFTVRLGDASWRGEPHEFGAGPSSVIDPGEWLSMAELYRLHAEEHLAGGAAAGAEVAVFALAVRVGAYDEILKFLPDDADAVPEPAFRSAPGRMVYESVPERFTRESLAAERAEAKKALDRLLTEYGEEDE